MVSKARESPHPGPLSEGEGALMRPLCDACCTLSLSERDGVRVAA